MTTDGRRDQRQSLALKIRFKSATLADFVEQHARDISRGGIFVKMGSPMPVGTLVKFDLRLGEDESIIQGVGRVVWRREDTQKDAPAGMGIKFIKLDDQSRANLDSVLERKPETGGASGEAPTVETIEGDEGPTRPPSPIAPMRPASAPPSAKRTMVGIGLSSRPADPNGSPVRESPSGNKALSGAPPAVLAAHIRPTPAVDGGLSEPPLGAGAALFTGIERPSTQPSTDDGFFNENEGGLLADISSAIDNALSETPGSPYADQKPKAAQGARPAAAPAKAVSMSPIIGIVAKPTPAPTPAPLPEPESTPKVQAQKRAAEERANVAAANAPKGSSIGLIVALVVLVLGGGGAAAWWFLMGPGAAEPTPEATPPKPANVMEFSTAEAAEDPNAIKAVPPSPEPGKPVEPAAAAKVGSFAIESQPEGALVFVDGKQHDGATPVELKLPADKEVEIAVKKFGFVSKLMKQTPVAGEIKKLSFTLEAAKIRLVLRGSPEGAIVRVNGETWGKVPRTIFKDGIGPSVAYTLSKKGYEDLPGTLGEADWTEEQGVFTATITAALKAVEAPSAGTAPAAGTAEKAKKPKTKPAAAAQGAGTRVVPAETKPEEKPTEAKAEEKPAAPKAEEKPAAPKAEEKPAAPKAEEKPAAPKKPAVDENPFG